MSALNDIKEAILSVTDNLFYLEADKKAAAPYVIYQQTGGRYLYANDLPSESILRVQIEIYTTDESKTLTSEILKALDEKDISYSFPIPVYEPELKMIRTIIECEGI